MFRKISERLVLSFEESSQVRHDGGMGSIREDFIIDFLKKYLPKKYAVGRGEVITSQNTTSGQIDVIIYDDSSCPVLIPSDTHAVYPVESVYGAISIKSHLGSSELKEAYSNISKFKQVLRKDSFTNNNSPGFSIGLKFPMPVTGVIAYASNRSLNAIREQVKDLDSKLDDINLRPDFVAVIGLGIIGPQTVLRDNFNSYQLPTTGDEIAREHKTGRHTLLRLYMKMLNELNKIVLRPLDLIEYERMPGVVGTHRVSGHDRFVRFNNQTGAEDTASALTLVAINAILAGSLPVTLRQFYLNSVGSIPHGLDRVQNLDGLVYQFNPKSLPPISASRMSTENGRPVFDPPAFQPIWIHIDGNSYAVDFSALPDGSFEVNNEYTADELFSQYGYS